MTLLMGGENTGIFDEAAEDGVGDAGHGGEDRGWGDGNVVDGEACGHAGVSGHRVLDGRVPLLLLECVLLLHRDFVAFFVTRFGVFATGCMGFFTDSFDDFFAGWRRSSLGSEVT